jgi:acyl-CoA synthetase (AMP-forming)/AMP-acid ligase II
MKRPENNQWLDQALSEVIGSKETRTDFEQWRRNHPQTVEMLTSRTNRKASTSPGPLKTRRKIMFSRNTIRKVAAILAIVIGLGTISVVGVNIGRYYYFGRNNDGAHIFHSEDWETVVTLDDNQVTDVEQTRQDLEEIEGLRQQNKRELLQVEITMTDGTLEMRVHVYKYELSDGRTTDMREGVPGGAYALNEALWEEWLQLRTGPGEHLGTYEETVEGRVISFKRQRYSLSDGTEVIYSIGYPKDDQ